MSATDTNTPTTKTITIAGNQFDVSVPYTEGHTCTAAEAKALNQVRAENIRNNCAKAVKQAVEEGKANGEIAKMVSAYDADYVFTLASAGGGRSVDPVEKEAKSLARGAIKTKLEKEGRKLKDIDKEKLAEAIERVAGDPKIVALAKKNVKQRAELAEAAGDEIGV